MNVETRQMRTLEHPIYALSPDGKWAITVDYARVNDMRPGYGYKGIADKYADQKAPKESGIWKVDLKTGKAELLVSLADAVATENADSTAVREQYVNIIATRPELKDDECIAALVEVLKGDDFAAYLQETFGDSVQAF